MKKIFISFIIFLAIISIVNCSKAMLYYQVVGTPTGLVTTSSLNVRSGPGIQYKVVATVNKNPIVRFSALVHDIGKGTTPESMLPHHYDHDKRGLTVFDEWNKRIKFPNDWKKAAKFIIKTHMRAPLLKKPGKIVDLLMQIHFNNLTYKDFNNIIFADHNSLPYYLEHSQQIVDELLKISGNDCPEGLTGKQIGDWIFTERIRKYLNIIKTQNI